MATSLRLPTDYVDLLHSFVEAEVEFLLIGGWAVAVHGNPRATQDMDILVRATPENAARVFGALQTYGAPLQMHSVTKELFSTPRYGYRIGRKPVQIEILTTIDGVEFSEAHAKHVLAEVDGIAIPVIGRDALLKNKRAAGRHKDLADVDALEEQ